VKLKSVSHLRTNRHCADVEHDDLHPAWRVVGDIVFVVVVYFLLLLLGLYLVLQAFGIEPTTERLLLGTLGLWIIVTVSRVE